MKVDSHEVVRLCWHLGAVGRRYRILEYLQSTRRFYRQRHWKTLSTLEVELVAHMTRSHGVLYRSDGSCGCGGLDLWLRCNLDSAKVAFALPKSTEGGWVLGVHELREERCLQCECRASNAEEAR